MKAAPEVVGSAPDLRILAVAASAWAAALATWGGFTSAVLLTAVAAGVGSCWLWWRRRRWVLVAALVVAGVGTCGAVLLSHGQVEQNPLRVLAEQRATVTALVVLRSDPARREGRFGPTVVANADVLEFSARGHTVQLRTWVLVVFPEASLSAELPPRGTTVWVAGALRPSDRPERSAVLDVRTGPAARANPGILAAAGNRVRDAVKLAVADQPSGPRGLVPALVDGQDDDLPPRIVEDFHTTGMTHLTTSQDARRLGHIHSDRSQGKSR